ncbi:MAG: glycosyltransferase family 4 protein [Bacteroidetes bacterium]|nr:glycosyltransferase family 4 protein [Bacteroidota bacterium]HET6244015.1 glycosyltransferase family 4 protein [Bacteroidia bacterium]
MKNDKITVVKIISGIDKALAFEWIATLTSTEKIQFYFIFLNNKVPQLHHFMVQNNIPSNFIKFSSKLDFFFVLPRLFFMLRKIKPSVVHTHLYEANLLGIFISFILRVPKRIHTRHHSTFHHQYHPKHVKIDRLINYLSTDIIAISENVKLVLTDLEKVPEKKIHLIRHGFDLKGFNSVSEERINKIREKYNLKDSMRPVIGVISRYLNLKGIQYIIPAFKNILVKYPHALLILANAKGSYEKEIKLLLKQIPTENYLEIIFEEDIFALYKSFDLFIHVPINKQVEAFGQTYVEALAAKIPSVFTLSGIAPEFITHKQNALIVDYANSDQIYKAIELILSDKELAIDLTNKGLISINPFNIERFIDSLTQLYSSNNQ